MSSEYGRCSRLLSRIGGVGVSEAARFDEFCGYDERRSDEGRGPRAGETTI
jgi:hypothetical protein